MSGATRPASRVTSENLSLACALRDEWLGHGLSTLPADRARAEDAIRGLYRLLDEPPPRFVWVASPAQARELLLAERQGGRAADTRWRLGGGSEPRSLAGRLASLQSGLRTRLDSRVDRWRASSWRWTGPDWPSAATLDPQAALAAGVPPDVIVDVAVGDVLHSTLGDALRAPMRTALVADTGSALGLTWYGQQDAAWAGPYDIRRRAGMAHYSSGEDRQLGLWAELARSTGWWWPAEGRCVLAERPAEIRTEPLPHGRHGERRLHREDGPAVRFSDGAAVHSLHGTLVPEWVVTEPTVERIHGEPNVEVRRCAIERLGWDTYVERAELELVATAADPGNPGSQLRLYHMPQQTWGVPARLLLAVNGSVEPDGRRRRYGLSVPPYFDDPLAAAGWSYGLSGRQYARLARRT